MSDRERLIAAFLGRAGWGGARIAPLAADASFRRYLRIALDGATAVLMDAPPEHERTAPYVLIARHLRALGLGAPEVLATDEAAGLLLLEDLGDDTFTRLLARGEDEGALYRLATDVLIALHARPSAEAVPKGVPRYDDALLEAEADLLVDWYLPAVFGRPAEAGVKAAYRAAWREAYAHARAVPETLVLRDFHVDNLLRLPGKTGIAACGLVDFQDAVAGPASYDFVSLIEDARRDVSPALAAALRRRYLDAFPALDPAAFDASVAVLGAQRHCKVIGIFTRLCVRDRKPGYLRHIPRVWRLLEGAAGHPALAPVRDWLDRAVPPGRRVVPDVETAA